MEEEALVKMIHAMRFGMMVLTMDYMNVMMGTLSMQMDATSLEGLSLAGYAMMVDLGLKMFAGIGVETENDFGKKNAMITTLMLLFGHMQ